MAKYAMADGLHAMTALYECEKCGQITQHVHPVIFDQRSFEENKNDIVKLVAHAVGCMSCPMVAHLLDVQYGNPIPAEGEPPPPPLKRHWILETLGTPMLKWVNAGLLWIIKRTNKHVQ